VRCLTIVLAGAILEFGCAPKPIPPAIVAVDAPATDTADLDGSYPFYVIVLYSDPDDAPATIRWKAPSLGIGGDISCGGCRVGSRAVGVPLKFPANTPKGALEYDLWLIDQAGLESAAAKEMVLLQ